MCVDQGRGGVNPLSLYNTSVFVLNEGANMDRYFLMKKPWNSHSQSTLRIQSVLTCFKVLKFLLLVFRSFNRFSIFQFIPQLLVTLFISFVWPSRGFHFFARGLWVGCWRWLSSSTSSWDQNLCNGNCFNFYYFHWKKKPVEVILNQ